MTFRPRLGHICLMATLLAGASCRQAVLPELPAISMQGFVPLVRAEVQKALADAQANPRDAAANGRLGMVLHAHQQYASAETCYRRANLLALKSFEWFYYLALVQELQGKNAEAAGHLRHAVRLKPEYTAAHLRLADVLATTGYLDECGSRKS